MGSVYCVGVYKEWLGVYREYMGLYRVYVRLVYPRVINPEPGYGYISNIEP